ncbi:MAG: DsrE family protein [Planctomycetes bacterium]|nr:DsrE family protein [Planctomycetota bacterium]
MGKTLNVVERAYHATLEEQDDVALWFSLAMKVQGNLEQSILLRGNAVNYLVRGQDAGGLRIGDLALDPPPRILDDLEMLKGKGIDLYAVEEDLASRGVPKDRLMSGVEVVKKSAIPDLFARHDRIWYW